MTSEEYNEIDRKCRALVLETHQQFSQIGQLMLQLDPPSRLDFLVPLDDKGEMVLFVSMQPTPFTGDYFADEKEGEK